MQYGTKKGETVTRRSTVTLTRVATSVAACLFSLAFATDLAAQSAATVYVATPTNRLITVSSTAPGVVLRNVPITNLSAGETVVGLDVRPANKLLYGVGSSSQLYIINPMTGAAIRIASPLIPALQGTSFGFDFNPTVDRIRIVSNTGQNLRVNPDTAAVTVDGTLSYSPGDPFFGTAPNVAAAGYTNPDTNPATGTTLFDIDFALDNGVTQAPPNEGRLNTFLGLGFNTTEAVSLDFDTTGDAFIAAQRPGEFSSFLFQFSAGVGRVAGIIGGGEVAQALAVSLGTPAIPAAGQVYATTINNELVTFNADTPGTIIARGAITNLAAGEQILGIDFRPANNLLYALGSSSQLYLIDPFTAIASRIGPQLTTALSGTEFGFDFNPAVDRIRVVSDSGQNLRLHPETGAVAFVDTNLAYAASDVNAGRVPRVVGAAYTDPDNDPATGTTLFVIDAAQDLAATQDPPNAGILNTFFRFGVDVPERLSVDIGRSRILIMAAPAGISTSFLYDATAAPRFLGAVGVEGVRAIAISLGR